MDSKLAYESAVRLRQSPGNKLWREGLPPMPPAPPIKVMVDGREYELVDCRDASSHSGHIWRRKWCRGHSHDRT